MSRHKLARYWVLAGVISLLVSGLLSVVITGAKMPFVKSLLGDLEYIRWSLVIHVNLATLIWYTSIPLGLNHLIQDHPEAKKEETLIPLVGFVISMVGILLMVSALPGNGVVAILSNYIPMITHPRHDLGIALYIIGVLMNYLDFNILLPKIPSGTRAPESLVQNRFGMWVGAVFYLLTTVALIASFNVLSKETEMEAKTFYELGMWGGGHLLQHSSTVYLVVVWGVLIGLINPAQKVWDRNKLFPTFAFLAVPIFIASVLIIKSPLDSDYRDGFTLLMRWGIFPAVVFYVIRSLYIMGSGFFKNFIQDANKIALFGSFVLINLGFIYGSLIRGYDLRTPGHYHATIGAVTIAFMAITHHLLFGQQTKTLRFGMLFYSIGQTLFATGMFTAGYFGVGRKTYGAEHVLNHNGQVVGFAILGIGGLIALVGGICFGVSVIKSLRQQKSGKMLGLLFRH